VNGPGSTIRDRNSLGKTHSIQVALSLVSEEWPNLVYGPGSEIRDKYYSMLEKNSPDSPSMMFYFIREDALPYLTDMSGRMDQMTQFIS
jgi:hypothetical protein